MLMQVSYTAKKGFLMTCRKPHAEAASSAASLNPSCRRSGSSKALSTPGAPVRSELPPGFMQLDLKGREQVRHTARLAHVMQGGDSAERRAGGLHHRRAGSPEHTAAERKLQVPGLDQRGELACLEVL